MKKILLSLLLLVFVSNISFAEKNTLNGFKGYLWGTDFHIINQEKQLIWEKESDNEGIHISQKDSNSIEEYKYIFYDNKLIGGIVSFKTDTSYNLAMETLRFKLGKANRSQGYVWWSVPETQIKSPFFSNLIEFKSSHYLLKTKPEIEKQKRTNKYNRIFN